MSDAARSPEGGGLSRSVGLWQLVFYGTGTILGAGIFVVIGEVVAEAGGLAPLAYVLAALVAITTALSYAELAARVPTAGGPIDYTERAFGLRRLGSATGWVLVVANTVSAATITTGFVSYLGSFYEVAGWIPKVALIAALVAVACVGIKQSTWFMTLTTLIGVGTLLVVLWATRGALAAAPGAIASDLASLDGLALVGLMGGAFLAIYSFIGFGDMALTAEEVRDVERTLPRAIVIVMCIVFAFYLAVSMALVGGETGPIAEAEAPLVRAAERAGWPALPIAVASLFVIVNGALTQIIGASRLLLDLGRDGRGAPALMGRVWERFGTPVPATLAVGAAALGLALFLPLRTLASGTSLAILLVFAAVNASLVALKRRDQPEGVPDVPRWVPVAGAALCALALVGQGLDRAGVIGSEPRGAEAAEADGRSGG